MFQMGKMYLLSSPVSSQAKTRKPRTQRETIMSDTRMAWAKARYYKFRPASRVPIKLVGHKRTTQAVTVGTKPSNIGFIGVQACAETGGCKHGPSEKISSGDIPNSMRCNPGGTLVEPSRNPGGTLVEPWWNPGGTLVEPWWNPGGTLPRGRPGPPRSLPETPKLSAVGEKRF